jgi:hypothetical protein
MMIVYPPPLVPSLRTRWIHRYYYLQRRVAMYVVSIINIISSTLYKSIYFFFLSPCLAAVVALLGCGLLGYCVSFFFFVSNWLEFHVCSSGLHSVEVIYR